MCEIAAGKQSNETTAMDNANGDRKHQNPTILPPDHVSSPSHPTRKQKRLGPAPIASIEDTTHEDKHRVRINVLFVLWNRKKLLLDYTKNPQRKTVSGMKL